MGAQIVVNRTDEIGDLAAAYRTMVDDLKRTIITRDQLDQILQSMQDAIVVTSTSGEIRMMNPAVTVLLELEEQELLEFKPLEFLDLSEGEKAVLVQSIEHDGAIISQVGLVPLRNHEYKHVLFFCYQIGGNPMGFEAKYSMYFMI